MLARLIETLEKTKGDIAEDFHVLRGLLALTVEHPELCTQALLLIVRSRSADRLTLGHNEDVPRILDAIYATGDAGAVSIAEKIIDHLTKLGFENFRTISQTQRKPPQPGKDGPVIDVSADIKHPHYCRFCLQKRSLDTAGDTQPRRRGTQMKRVEWIARS